MLITDNLPYIKIVTIVDLSKSLEVSESPNLSDTTMQGVVLLAACMSAQLDMMYMHVCTCLCLLPVELTSS